mgnify:CR=1 FL=1
MLLIPQSRDDLVSNESRLAGPVDVPLSNELSSSFSHELENSCYVKMALPEGFPPSTSAFEARRSIH